VNPSTCEADQNSGAAFACSVRDLRHDLGAVATSAEVIVIVVDPECREPHDLPGRLCLFLDLDDLPVTFEDGGGIIADPVAQ